MDLPSHIQKPKLCSLRKWENYAGYGFNLHSEKGKSGQFIGKVDANSPADLGGLNSHDVLIEVNGINVEDASHNIVVGRVKSIPDRVDLFVCCKDTYSYCKENNIKLSSAMHNIMEYNTPMRQPPAEEKKPTSSIPTNRSDYQPTSTSAVAAAAAASLQAAVDECGGVEFEEVKPGELPERFRSDLSGEVPIRQCIRREEFKFALIGEEHFKVGAAHCTVQIKPINSMDYGYFLLVNGQPFEQFLANQANQLKCWILPTASGPIRVVLRLDSMEVYSNGEHLESTGEFTDGGSETHFELLGTPCFIRVSNSATSGRRSARMTYTMNYGNTEVPEAAVDQLNTWDSRW